MLHIAGPSRLVVCVCVCVFVCLSSSDDKKSMCLSAFFFPLSFAGSLPLFFLPFFGIETPTLSIKIQETFPDRCPPSTYDYGPSTTVG